MRSTLNAKLILLSILGSLLSVKGQNLKPIEAEMQGCFARKSFDSALVLSEKLLAEARRKDSSLYVVRAYYQKGLALYRLDSVKAAMDVFYAGLKLCTEPEHAKTKASIYNNLGAINYDQKNMAIAKSYYKEEIRIRKEIGDADKIVHCLINLSAMHRRLKELDSSGYVLKEAGTIIGPNTTRRTYGYYQHAVGTHFQSLFKRDSLSSEIDSAVVHYSKAIDLWMELDDKQEALRPLFNMGLIYHSLKQYAKALANYEKALQIVNDLKLEPEKVTVYGNLAELHWDMGDFKKSSDYFRMYIEAKEAEQKEELNYYALELDKQLQSEKQKETIQQQKLELAETGKRTYLYLFVAAAAFVLLILIVVYFTFTRRVQARVEEAKKKFFTNVVHEIRTPLSMIQAPLTMLKTEKHSPEAVAHFELAERNIKRLNELITQMLDISKMDADKYILNETFGDLEVFFKQIAENYSKTAAEKKISLITEFNFHHKLAFFDKDALEKIGGNLLDNAIKYSPGGSQAGISVSSDETEQGVELLINVWDTGIGIPEKDQQNIFDRFYRGDKTSKDEKGSGIGLSLVKDLIDLQKGKISLVSAENKGASFTIHLLLKNAGQVSGVFNSAGAGESAYQVLLVEDDMDILEFNANLLAKNNLHVIKANNAEDALKIIEKNLPDLIVSDIMLPGMQGGAFLETIRKNPESDHIPFIALSAKSSAPSRIEVLKAGAQNYLAKPFLPEELVALVLNQLEILSKKKAEFRQMMTETSVKPEEKLSTQDPYVGKMFDMILRHLDDHTFSVEKLADLMAINRSHFQRKVKALTGFSPSEIIKTVRLEKAKELLLTKAGNVTEVADLTGFSSQSYFTKCFTEHFGVSPTQMISKELNQNA